MKGIVVTVLAVIGGYAVWQWFQHKQGTLSHGFSATLNAGPLSASAGVGDYVVSPLASGVPSFNDAPIANGHGDQVAAAYHSNPMATIPGAPVYTPAFGPTTNQLQDNETSGNTSIFGS